MGNEIRREWVTIDGITHGRNEPDVAVPIGPRNHDNSTPRYGQVSILSPQDYVDAGISVASTVIEGRFGTEGLAQYREAMEAVGRPVINIEPAVRGRIEAVRTQIDGIIAEQ